MPLKIAIHFKADGDLLQNVHLALADTFSYSFEGESLNLRRSLSDWIQSYLLGKPTQIDFSQHRNFATQSPFQQKVTEGLLSIPFGSTLSYSELAKKIGIPKAARAVGNACGKNALPLLIPCHRIIQKNGKSVPSQGNSREFDPSFPAQLCARTRQLDASCQGTPRFTGQKNLGANSFENFPGRLLGGFAFDPEIKKRILLFERQHHCIF